MDAKEIQENANRLKKLAQAVERYDRLFAAKVNFDTVYTDVELTPEQQAQTRQYSHDAKISIVTLAQGLWPLDNVQEK